MWPVPGCPPVDHHVPTTTPLPPDTQQASSSPFPARHELYLRRPFRASRRAPTMQQLRQPQQRGGVLPTTSTTTSTTTSRRCFSTGSLRGGVARVTTSRHACVRVAALGFSFDDSASVEPAPRGAPPRQPSPKAFSAFGLRANSLLLYQHVFKGAVGEALLALMATSQKYQASNKDILASYTKFYALLLLSGYDCWRDYVLDQVLLGRDNSFARAVAQGQVDQGAPILQAAAYDLDTLQGLSVPLEVLAEYVGDVAPTAGSYWVSAASALAVQRPRKALPGDAPPVKPAVVIPGASADEGGARSKSPGSSSSSPAGAGRSFIGPPPTQEELAEWRAALASQDPWSAGLPLLQQYYSQHGFGITSRNSVLRWSKGGFEEASEGGLAAAAANPGSTLALPTAAAEGQLQKVLSLLSGAHASLAANTARHCAGLPAQHAVVCGPPGCGKSWLLWEGSLLAGRDAGLRVVDVPAGEVPNLLEAARGCARYPRLRFILVADHLDLPLRPGAGLTDLLAGLGAAGGSGWPSNTLLYLGASSTSTVSRSDPLVARCPLVVPVPGVEDEQAFLQVVQELLPEDVAGSSEAAARMRDAAVAWSAQQGMSLRSAVEFTRLARQ